MSKHVIRLGGAIVLASIGNLATPSHSTAQLTTFVDASPEPNTFGPNVLPMSPE